MVTGHGPGTRWRLYTATAAFLGAISVTGRTQAAAPQYVAPARLVLHLADLPPGFTQTAAVAHGNAESDRLDHLPPGTLERHGRLAAYETSFQRSGLVGLLAIQDSVLVYRSLAGARWQEQVSSRQAKNTFNGAHFLPMSVGRIGDEAAGYQWTGVSKGFKFTTFIVIFRRGVYDDFVSGVGLANATAPDDVIRLAHVIDSRIRSAR